LLASVDRHQGVFGAKAHRYTLAPPLSADELGGLERQLGVDLPDDYGRFVRELGARGAGPYYGLDTPIAPDSIGKVMPDPARAFLWEPGGGPPKLGSGRDRRDGTVVIAAQGCGLHSLLVVTGGRRGEVWTDHSIDGGPLVREAPSFLAWYEGWLDRAMLEWAEFSAPRIALDGPADPAELEGIAEVYELVAAHPEHVRTLGYLHLREKRWDAADAAFVAAGEGRSRLHLDRARLFAAKGSFERALTQVEHGLVADDVTPATGDMLLAVQERVLASAGRREEALAVLDARAASCFFSFDLHHRLARERLARNDLDGAGAALERAARMANILGQPTPIETRVPASFAPISAELRAAGRRVDADALVARVEIILSAN
jgi:hypothetical protein